VSEQFLQELLRLDEESHVSAILQERENANKAP
jgi:hypothetical protein